MTDVASPFAEITTAGVISGITNIFFAFLYAILPNPIWRSRDVQNFRELGDQLNLEILGYTGHLYINI